MLAGILSPGVRISSHDWLRQISEHNVQGALLQQRQSVLLTVTQSLAANFAGTACPQRTRWFWANCMCCSTQLWGGAGAPCFFSASFSLCFARLSKRNPSSSWTGSELSWKRIWVTQGRLEGNQPAKPGRWQKQLSKASIFASSSRPYSGFQLSTSTKNMSGASNSQPCSSLVTSFSFASRIESLSSALRSLCLFGFALCFLIHSSRLARKTAWSTLFSAIIFTYLAMFPYLWEKPKSFQTFRHKLHNLDWGTRYVTPEALSKTFL